MIKEVTEPVTLRGELGPLLRLAVPLAVTQIASAALPWTDALVLARMGTAALAGGGLGATVLALATIVIACLVGALSSLLARSLRDGEIERSRGMLAQGRWLVLVLGGACACTTPLAGPVLRAAGQSSEVAEIAAAYLVAAAPAFVALPLASVQRHAFAATGRARWVAVGWAVAVPLNLALDVILGFGVAGAIPPMGVAGIGTATGVVSAALVIGLEIVLHRSAPPLRGAWTLRPDRERAGDLLRLGGPIALAVLAEVGVFSAASFGAGILGTTALAAHQIAVQVVQASFVFANGLAQAAAARVAAASDARAASRAALLGSALWGTLAMIAVVAARPAILRAYGGELGADAVRAASEVLVVVAAFQLFDAVQVVAAGALRGVRDTRSAMIWSAVAYGAVAPAVAGATVAAGLGLTGIWLGLTAGLAIAAAALGRRALAVPTA